MNYYPDFFNDVFGPVMQPGSSSHTAAPCRLGLLARAFLGEEPVSARFILDRDGSFAGTFGLMNEDKGMLAGVMGFGPDDERLYDVFTIARQIGLDYEYVFDEMKESDHINSIKIVLGGGSGKTVSLVGDSTGGGMVRIRKLNQFAVDFIGDTYVLIVLSAIPDKQIKTLIDTLEGVLDSGSITSQGNTLFYIKASQKPDLQAIRELVDSSGIALLEPVLPVVNQKGRKPQLFSTVKQWLALAEEWGVDASDVAIQYEMDSSLWTKEQVTDYMHKIKGILYRQITAPYAGEIVDRNPFYRYDGAKWTAYQQQNKVLSGSLIGQVVQRAIGVNSKVKGVPIVPGPMGTGGGYLFSALYTVKETYGFSDEALVRGLFVAAAIGAIAYTLTNPTGEVVGCAGECGVCCAMGAAAIVEMAGGTSEKIDIAASLALQAFIGLPCDPVVGGSGAPCYSRVITAASMAVVYADLALAGVEAVLPYDEMLLALDTLGRRMPPELLCTSRGGCCVTPTAKRCESNFKQWSKESSRNAQNRS